MKNGLGRIASVVIFVAAQCGGIAAVRYVSVSSTNPVAPYTSWATAAGVIQDAVDVAAPGDEIVVTNGVYGSGGRVVYGTVTNRVAVTKPLVLRSVNGPQATAIVGYQVPGAIFGPSAVRCVYLTNGARLLGFTITNGASRWGGEEPPQEDTWGGGVWCESTSAIVSNCVVINNQAGNQGGGVYQGTIYDSTIQSNVTRFNGGGVFAGVLHRCAVIGNVASYFGNYGMGGGVYGSELRNCVLTGNAADIIGGGAWGGTLINCTLTMNTASVGGGAYDASLTNSLVYFNTAVTDPNYVGTNLSFCCTTPLPADGTGNFTNPPELADLWHLSAGSPCRAAGITAAVSGTDIDRQAWLNPPSVGADEFYSGASGPLSVELSANWTNVAVGVAVQLTSQISGHAASNFWSFGDGATATNEIIASHQWAAPGDYPVVLTVFNTNFPSGVSATVVVHVDATPRFVALNNPAPAWPHNSWASAATNIQDAVDAAPVGGLVLVSNGVYATGGRAVDYYATMTNRVAVTVPLTLQSVNGPAVTCIQGYQIPVAINGSSAVRCVYLCDGARLNGFTLTNGATLSAGFSPPIVFGGGALCQSAAAVISNCVFAGNSCIDSGAGAALGTIYNSTFLSNSAYQGGAVSDATLFGCTLSGNRAENGGGAASSALTDCLITNNASLGMYRRGGGVYYCALTNCQLVANTSQDYAGGAHASTLVNCLIAGNSAPYEGGGALNSTLFNCLVRGNSCSQFGGGLYGSTAYNCTVVLNSAGFQGGGGHSSTLFNSIVYDNSAGAAATSNYQGGTFYFSCTSPLVGTNNIAGPPEFASASAGDFRLQPASPCVNAGNNAYAPSGTDLGGRPRILDGTVDMGAYEYEPPPPGPPFATTLSPSGSSSNAATLHGVATPNGLPSTAWFEWGQRGSYLAITAPVSVGGGSGVVHLSATVSNLVRGLDYQCRLAVSNSAGVRHGAVQMFASARRAQAWGYNDYGQTNLPPALGDATAAEAGGLHSLVLKADGTAVAWGHNVYGQTNVPAGLSNVVAVAAGYYHNLALKSDSTVVAWGSHFDRSFGIPATPPAGLSNVVLVAGGGSHSLALKADGTVVAWGYSYFGQTNVPAGLSNVVGIACGYEHSLALKDDGTIVAWGFNDYSQANVPVGLTNVVAVSAGHWFSMALKADGTLVAWGENSNGTTNVPAGLSNVVSISGGTWHSLAMKADGSVTTWGFGVPGPNVMPSGLSNAVAASAGGSHNLALVDNSPPEVLPLTVKGPANHDVVITLQAVDHDLDNFSFRVASLATAGALYQYAAGERGAPIAAPDTAVSDSLGRLIFAPAPDGSGQPYATFAFVANDGLDDSAPATVTVNIIATAPFAHTLAASQITTNTATLHGMATPNGLPTLAWFEWGTNAAYGQATSSQAVGDLLNVVHVAGNVVGLAAGRTYWCRLVVSNQAGVSFGAPQLFLTGGRATAWGFSTFSVTNVPPGLRGLTQVAAGYYHSLVLNTEGRVTAWGGFAFGVTNVPAGLSNVVAVASGSEHALALVSDGSLVTWGSNLDGERDTPPGLSNIVSIAGGYRLSAALLADGRAKVWGQTYPGVTNVLATFSNVVAVSPGMWGSSHMLVLLHDGTVRACGDNFDGETNVPPGLSNVVAVAAGGSHSLALRRDGTVVGWGADGGGQATPPPGLTNVIAIQAGAGHSLALRADGTVVMWGFFVDGGTDASASVGNVVAISAGQSQNLVLHLNHPPTAQPLLRSGPAHSDLVIQLSGTDPENDPLAFRLQSLSAFGSLYQFTNGTRGDLIVSNETPVLEAWGRVIFAPAADGLGNPYDSFAFVADDGDAVSAPASVTIAIVAPIQAFTLPATEVRQASATLNGFVAPNGFATTAWFEWGTNLNYGQFTSATNASSSAGVVHHSEIIGGLAAGQVVHFRLVASNASQTVTGADQQFITGGKVGAWGDDSSGQSGVPLNLGAVGAVAGGLSHSLALRADGTVAAWGNNAHGQTNVPASLANVASVAAGGFHNVALLANGTVAAWGRNNVGQTNVPAGANNGVAVAAGGQHSLVLHADGSVVAWGDNSQGQRTVPASLTNVVGIAAGWYHNVVLLGDGTVTAWGANTYGQTNVPAGLTNVVWVGAGLYHSLALRGDGSLVAWGLNSSGQTNVASALTNNVAAACGGSHNLVLRGDGTLTGWGNNFSGQATPPGSASNVVNFAAGGSHSLALMVAGFVPPAAPVFDVSASGLTPAGGFQLVFTGTTEASYRVWASTNLVDWEVLGAASLIAPGEFLFLDVAATNWPQRFYRATAP